MPEIKIRQSRNGSYGWIIALILLGGLYFAKYGPALGRVQDKVDAEQHRQEQIQRALEDTTAENMERVGKALKEGKAVQQSLEKINRAVEQGNQSLPADER